MNESSDSTDKKKWSFLSDPTWQGIGALVGLVLVGLIVTLLWAVGILPNVVTIIGKGIKYLLSSFPPIRFVIGKTIKTPLGMFSAILVLLSFAEFLVFRHQALRVRVGMGILIFLGLAGFGVATRIQDYRESLAQLEAEKASLQNYKENLEQKAETHRRAIQYIGSEFLLVYEENQRLKGELKSKEGQIKKHKDRGKQEDEETESLRKQVSNLKAGYADSLSKQKELEKKLSLSEEKAKSLQMELWKLKETVSTSEADFEYVEAKLFLIKGNTKELLFSDVKGFFRTDSNKKIAIITYPTKFHIMVFDCDPLLSNKSDWEVDASSIENFKWVSDTVFSVYLSAPEKGILRFHDLSFRESGAFEVTIDETNTLVEVRRITVETD